MEWIAAIWNKINKPLHFLLVGAAIVFFAPKEMSWAGYIFVAAGIAGSVEWGASHLGKWWEQHKRKKTLREAITKLNGDEKSLLQTQIGKGEQTFYMDPFRSGSIPNHVRLMGLYQGLADKGILEISTTDGKTVTLHVTSEAWKQLAKPV